ncbi:FaeA/PapI family transcriptional regulator [Rahnella sp. ChDrAdgB13]|uniref:FaeA/PapI family transcriptional regulator n=1 Tax=Rahnella sp. ChDrAdgB13 TaxID=1850581 RepID=UPI001AD85F94|nr:FaeA/PapI family transcriptional regulator [Rahnella sp. ChDrAdgB13]
MENKPLSQNDRVVLDAIIKIFLNKKVQKEKEIGWVTTRDIAEQCDITIYRARHYLMRLEECGAVIHRPTDKKTALNWKPTGNMI